MAETTAFAYHEAGHAVAAHVLQHGPAPMYVTIVPDGVTRGHVRPRPVRPQGDPASTMEVSLMEMVVRFAGPIAQIRHNPSSWQPINGYSDWHVACRLAILISRGMRVLGSDMDPRRQARTLLVAAAVEAGRLVEREWVLIERLARALVDRKTLTGEEIAAVLAELGGLR